MRRRPAQRRSRATVDAIEEAAALILEGGDASRLTTNHIAARAGVSIGSLYEYFSDKDDIFRSHGEAEAERLRSDLDARWRASMIGGAPVGLREIVRLPLRPFRARPAFAKAMLLRYGRTRWALGLAQRQLAMFLGAIGRGGAGRVLGGSRERITALVPRVAARVAAWTVDD